jgi:hypothetical protein
MAAVAGVLMFNETGSFAMYAGVALTVFGLTLMHSNSTQAPSGGQLSDVATGEVEEGGKA